MSTNKKKNTGSKPNAKSDATPTLYPIGGTVYASVRTWGGRVRIHIRHYALKNGHPIPTQRGVTLDVADFALLLKVQKKLISDFHAQTKLLPEQSCHTSPKNSDVAQAQSTEAAADFTSLTAAPTSHEPAATNAAAAFNSPSFAGYLPNYDDLTPEGVNSDNAVFYQNQLGFNASSCYPPSMPSCYTATL